MDRRLGLVFVTLFVALSVGAVLAIVATPAAAQDYGPGTVMLGGEETECEAMSNWFRGYRRADYGFTGAASDARAFREWRCGIINFYTFQSRATRGVSHIKRPGELHAGWTVTPGVDWVQEPVRGTETLTPTETPGGGSGGGDDDGTPTGPPGGGDNGTDGNGRDGNETDGNETDGNETDTGEDCVELPPGMPGAGEGCGGGGDGGDGGGGWNLSALVGTVIDATVGRLTDAIGGAVLGFVRGVFSVMTDLLADRPVPVRDGGPALLQPPTNPPMTTVHALWKTVALPAALGVWALFVLVVRFVDLAPPALVADRSARRHKARAWVQLPLIAVSFAYASLVLWLSVGISQLFMPSPDVMLPGVNSLLDHALAGGVTGLLLFASSGILAVLIVLEIGLTYLAIFVLAPAQPLGMALELPDVSVLKYVASVGRSMQGWFVPCAMMPVPTAVILGLGYPVINALRSGAATAVPGGDLLGTPLWVLLLLVMWYAALLAPIALLLGSRHTRPAALAVGALGALGTLGVASRVPSMGRSAASAGGAAAGSGGALAGAGSSVAGALPGGGSGATPGGSSTGRVDPIRGSPFATDGGSMVAGGGSSSPTAGGGDAGGTTIAWAAGGGGGAPTPSSGGAPTEHADTAGARARAMPDGQRYEVGYYREGEWQPVESATFDRDWLADRGFDRMQEVHAREGHSLRVRGAADETVYAGPGSGPSDASTTNETN